MIAWWWLIPAVFLACWSGFSFCVILTAGRCSDCIFKDKS